MQAYLAGCLKEQKDEAAQLQHTLDLTREELSRKLEACQADLQQTGYDLAHSQTELTTTVGQ
jgi:outer membrane murein-binding lipoprotein Lpp